MIHKTRDRVLFINDILSKNYIIESVGQRRGRFYLISTVDLEGLSLIHIFSHVLNRTRYVSPEITERVMAAVDELGYEPLRRRNRGEEPTAAKRGCMGLIIDRRLLTVCGCRSYVRMSGRYEWITISVDGALTEKQLHRYMKQ